MANWYEYAESFADDYEELVDLEKEMEEDFPPEMTEEDLECMAAWYETQKEEWA